MLAPPHCRGLGRERAGEVGVCRPAGSCMDLACGRPFLGTSQKTDPKQLKIPYIKFDGTKQLLHWT